MDYMSIGIMVFALSTLYIFKTHTLIEQDMYGRFYSNMIPPHSYKLRRQPLFILIAYGVLSGLPFFIGNLFYPKYVECLDTILFGSLCGLLIISYLRPLTRGNGFDPLSITHVICDKAANIALTSFVLMSATTFLLPIDIWHALIPITGLTPILIYLWITDTYSLHPKNNEISKNVLSYIFAGISLGVFSSLLIIQFFM